VERIAQADLTCPECLKTIKAGDPYVYRYIEESRHSRLGTVHKMIRTERIHPMCAHPMSEETK